MSRKKTAEERAALVGLERAHELLSYEPDTGVLRWRVETGNLAIGTVAGCASENLRRTIRVEGKLYKEHRLIWLLSYGRWPSKQIDHINGNPLDNRLCNLREATQSQNMANAKRPVGNRSGWKGVSWDSRKKKWYARIRDNGKHRFLGLFDCPEKAHAAYAVAAKAIYGEFARMS